MSQTTSEKIVEILDATVDGFHIAQEALRGGIGINASSVRDMAAAIESLANARLAIAAAGVDAPATGPITLEANMSEPPDFGGGPPPA